MRTPCKSWGKFDHTNTEIIEIETKSNNNYKVNVNFQYDLKSRYNSIFFEFDDNNKIIAIY